MTEKENRDNADIPAAGEPVAAQRAKPTERGIYAWINEGSAALVQVHTRPTVHSKGGVLNGSVIRNSMFYNDCEIDQWTGGTWYGPLEHPAPPAASGQKLTNEQRDSIWVAAEALDKADQHVHATELRALLRASSATASDPEAQS